MRVVATSTICLLLQFSEAISLYIRSATESGDGLGPSILQTTVMIADVAISRNN